MTVEGCTLAATVVVHDPALVNLYGCTIGAYSRVGPFVEMQRGVQVGKFCKISSHTFVCDGVVIGDRVFVGHGVMFTNDRYPGILDRFVKVTTVVEDDVVIGSGAVVLPVRIGHGAIIGAGAVVVADVPALSVVVGNPARVVRQFSDKWERDWYVERQCDDLCADARCGAAFDPVPGPVDAAEV